ncbi:MAG: prephenate dehydrogenase/arogenate dehydrogenase family protein [Anaerolineae bacterium]|nr:prephenate dehydrogenase/arogenate dehydrogenase family protein [Anaerolineae bacterium]
MKLEHLAIIGADPISVSIALKLKEISSGKGKVRGVHITGYDADSRAADLARAYGAFDRVERRPGPACRDADLVIISVPLAAMRDTFAAIAASLRPGSLVTDTARLKTPVMRWASELLPDGVYFIGGHPIINPAVLGAEPLDSGRGGVQPEKADAGLLKGALYCLTPADNTPAQVIDFFSALALELEAYPYFIDTTEHDGLQVGVEALPDLLAVALLRATVETPGWQEMRKFAGYSFAAATAAAASPEREARERHTAILLNREHIVQRLNILVHELLLLRDMLAQGETGALEGMLAAAVEGRAHWIADRMQGMWGREGYTGMDQVPSAGDQLRHLFFGEALSRRKREG